VVVPSSGLFPFAVPPVGHGQVDGVEAFQFALLQLHRFGQCLEASFQCPAR
jgi:hypothetical protein